ncbi:MAG TPA: UDP-N-acetylmuramate dehydrogenase [Alphaproteobacteria bacterium]|nr:UDP-N-acetylmuramate dehydrogenase [Alphaproteobacteria bacterium]
MPNPAMKIEIQRLPQVRGRYTHNAPLGQVGWFRTGGRAEILFKPADAEDLATFLSVCPADFQLTIIGVLSNTIVRDGGVDGVVIRLGREFAHIEILDDHRIYCGAAALDVNVAETAAQNNIAGLEFLCGVPGSIGGALAMNAGAYGGEMKDVLISADFIDRLGQKHTLGPADLNMTYRHSEIPAGWIAVGATLQGKRGNYAEIEAYMNDVREKRSNSQPIRSQTGGSTFKNPKPEDLVRAGLPETTKAWQLVDMVGCRGLMVGGAQMSEQHANFMINTGTATAADLEALGEEIRRRVKEKFGYDLQWEVARIGNRA